MKMGYTSPLYVAIRVKDTPIGTEATPLPFTVTVAVEVPGGMSVTVTLSVAEFPGARLVGKPDALLIQPVVPVLYTTVTPIPVTVPPPQFVIVRVMVRVPTVGLVTW